MATDAIPAAPGAVPDVEAPYDTQRDVSCPKPVLRGWLHLLWFEASLVTGTLVLTHTRGATRVTAVAAYAASVTAMFGTSALYHRGNWSPLWNRRLQRLDHAMIFLLIGGTATPAFLLAMPGPLGWLAWARCGSSPSPPPRSTWPG
jgi:hemolysin III